MVEIEKTKLPKSVLIAAIAGIVILETVALIKGINGVILTLALVAIAGMAGWVSPQLKLK